MQLRFPYFASFVSYARQDEAMARELVGQLEAKGADVWFDLNSITLGSPLDGSLRSAVADAQYLTLVATPAAAKSDYVRLEVEAAVRHGLRIVPIVFAGQLPEGFRPWLPSAALEPAISSDSGSDALGKAVLARLDCSPFEQLRWLQSQRPYDMLRKYLAQARSNRA
jgi:TIR domain